MSPSQLGVRGRLFAVSVAVVVLVGIASALLLEFQLRGWLTDRIDARIVRDLALVSVMVEEQPPADDAALEALTAKAGAAVAARITMIAADGTVLADSSLSPDRSAQLDNHGDRPEILAARAHGEGRAMRFSATLNQDMRYIARTVRGAGDVHTVRLSLAETSIDDTIARLRVFIGVAGLLGLALALLMSGLASHLFSGALRELVGLARKQVALIRAGDPYELLPTDGPAEVAELADALNQMGADLTSVLHAVESERDRFRSLLDGMGVALLAVDSDNRVTLSNQVARELLELSFDPRGRPLTDLLRDPTVHAHLERRRDHASRGPDDDAQDLVEFVLPGSRRTLLAHATPGEGGAVIVIQDITEMRRLESVRRDFVANVSHELRTPVSVIRANTETLLDGALEHPEMSRRFLDASLRNAERLSKLIDDLLDLSRIEAGRFDVELARTSVAEVASRTLDSLREKAVSRRVTLVSELPDELEVMAEAGALEQVLTNLVDNAVKYGHEGARVTVRATESGGRVRVEVEDDGPGIERQHRDRLFERFYRVDPGRSRDMGGTGLGLSIVKHLVVSMSGTVGMEAVEPRGSRFWIELAGVTDGRPAAEPTHDAQAAPARKASEDVARPERPLSGGDGIQPIRDRLLIMAGRVETMIVQAVDALVRRDPDLARETITADRAVNQDEIDLDAMCRQALAAQPETPDELAFLTLTLKMVTDLERIGDLAVNLSERAIDLAIHPPLERHRDIPKMGKLVGTMVHDSIGAFVARDVDLARAVIARDDEVDQLYHLVFNHLLQLMLDDTSAVQRGIHVQAAAKFLERMADHSTNLAEQVVWLVGGTDIRHEGKRDIT